MVPQGLLTALLLPPVAFALAAVAGGLLAWRGRRRGGLLAALMGLGILALATPLVAGLLTASLERSLPDRIEPVPRPGAVIVLGGDAAHGLDGPDVGALTLERLRAGAALARRESLPLLVTGGPNTPGDPPLAVLMARSLTADFGMAPRWVEPAARDTRENAAFGAALLRAEGVGAAYVVTHAWHLPRALESFARLGFPAVPAPVRRGRLPDGRAWDWQPRADHLATSWFALREWAGRLVYALRDG